MKKIISYACLSLLGSGLVMSQQRFGLSGSNYAGTHGIYQNPASIANSRMVFYLDLGSSQLGATNNYIKLPLGIGRISSDDWNTDNVARNENSRSKSAYVHSQFSALSFLVRLSPVHSFALTNRLRLGASFTNVSPQMAQILVDGVDEDDFLGKTYSNLSFNTNVNTYWETGLTYGRVIKETDAYALKGGLTIKRLWGFNSAHATSSNLSFSATEEPNPQMPVEQQTLLNIQQVNLKYGYVGSTENLLPDEMAGKGWGFNLGATFEKIEDGGLNQEQAKMMDSLSNVYRSRKDNLKSKMQNRYKYRVGISLMDIGAIRYSGDNIRSYDINRTNRQIVADSLDGAPSEIGDVINWGLGVTDADKKTSFTSALPTALQIHFDYHIKGKVYVNAMWIQSLRGKNSIGLQQPSSFSVTPRIEMRWFEFALPVGMTHNYSNFTLGTYLKLGIFHFGSDNIAGALGLGKTYGADFYGGVHIPVFAKGTAK